MTSGQNGDQKPVRLLFEMSREDNPRLYDDLIRFTKGTKRVNRLRFLAHEGLLSQHCIAAQGGAPPMPPRSETGLGASLSAARHTNQVFDAP